MALLGKYNQREASLHCRHAKRLCQQGTHWVVLCRHYLQVQPTRRMTLLVPALQSTTSTPLLQHRLLVAAVSTMIRLRMDASKELGMWQQNIQDSLITGGMLISQSG